MQIPQPSVDRLRVVESHWYDEDRIRWQEVEKRDCFAHLFLHISTLRN